MDILSLPTVSQVYRLIYIEWVSNLVAKSVRIYSQPTIVPFRAVLFGLSNASEDHGKKFPGSFRWPEI